MRQVAAESALPELRERPGRRFAGRQALVTGASQGIGRAIALALAHEGAGVLLLGRCGSTLHDVAVQGGSRCRPVVADLGSEDSLHCAVNCLGDNHPVDLLVHCGGQYVRGSIEETPAESLDTQYALSVRAPYLLTQMLLPVLRRRPSDIVFIGSTIRPTSNVGAVAAGQAAQQALVHTLRDELSGDDIRVLCVFPGRTATPRQARIFGLEGRGSAYRPDRLLQPEDIAAMMLDALSLPRRAEVTEVWVRPAEATY